MSAVPHSQPAAAERALPGLGSSLQFLGPDELDGRPFVGVDGAPPPGASLALAHWPGSKTPSHLGAATATEIVSNYMAAEGAGAPELVAVTNNHVDEDGLLAAWMLLARPDRPEQEVAAAVALAGDFARWTDPWAAKRAIAIAALAEPALTPLWEVRRALAERGRSNPSGPVHRAILPRIDRVLREPDRYATLWSARWNAVEADIALIDSGAVTLTDVPEADATLVRSPRPLEELALHPRTSRGLIVTALSDGVVLARQRYESWVEFPPAGTAPRVSLVPVAERLGQRDPDARWRADGPEIARATLTACDPAGSVAPTGLDAEVVLEEVIRERETEGDRVQLL